MNQDDYKKCPVCDLDSSVRTIGERYDDRYGYPGLFALLKCENCGHMFLQGDFKPELLKDLYSNYYPRSTFDVENHQPYQETGGINGWLEGEKSSVFRWVPRDVRILDIGCGFGESLGYHKARGCDVYGVEADENIGRVAERFGYKVHVGLFDSSQYEASFFDFVTLNQVIEHVTDPVHTLCDIAYILKPGGKVILSTPYAGGWGQKVFGKYWINWHAPYHLQFFTIRSMKLAAEQAGLVLERVVTITPSGWLHYQWIHLITCPKKGVTSIFWSPGGKWNFFQKVAIRLLTLMHQCKVNHVLTRLLDATGWGDNRVYFLRKP